MVKVVVDHLWKLARRQGVEVWGWADESCDQSTSYHQKNQKRGNTNIIK